MSAFLRVFPAVILAAFLAVPIRAQAPPPNVVFILADDVGWGDPSAYGNRRVETPHLDRMAEGGVLFTQAYMAGSVCSPSRTALLTGRFPAELRMFGHLGTQEINRRRAMPDYLDTDVPTIADLLKQAGYATAAFGKWHLGSGPEAQLPDAYGFETHKTTASNDPRGRNEWNLWAPELRPTATSLVVDEVLAFAADHRQEPFFVQAWLVDTHATLNPSEEQLAPFSHLSPPDVPYHGAMAVYFAALTEMDRQIGRLMDEIDRMGLGENTLIVFTSDNGPEAIEIGNASHSGVGSAGPFRGRKRSLYEGGIRVPWIVRWPAGAPAGRVDSTSIISGVDMLPTLSRLAGIAPPDDSLRDGEDVSDAFRGQGHTRTTPLHWEWRYNIVGHVWNVSPGMAARDGRWKLLMNPDGSRIELYDLLKDPRESDNVADEHPEIVRRLAERLHTWYAHLPEAPADARAGRDDYPWPR